MSRKKAPTARHRHPARDRTSAVDRRVFLARALSAAAAPIAWDLLAGIARAEPASTAVPPIAPSGRELPERVDVVVVGAGASGLAAARILSGAGRRVAVLEARDRIGGRTCTETFDGLPLDVGGQYLGPTQRRITRLTKELGLATVPTYDEGKALLEMRGRRRAYAGTIPKLGILSLMSLGSSMSKLDRLARAVDPETPWTARGARTLDATTLATWLSRSVRFSDARALLSGGLEMLLAADPARVSLLHALFFIRAAGGLDPLLAVKNGAQQERLERGMGELMRRYAEPIGPSIHLSQPVASISQDVAGVVVRAATGATIAATRAIVAVPPALAGRIDYRPVLSADRDQLTQSMPMGSVIKSMTIYPEAFWRADGLNGQMVSTHGPVFATFDNSPPGGKPGILLGFCVGRAAEEARRLPPEERRRTVLAEYARLFGPKAEAPTRFVEHSWADEEWSRGCFLGYFPPGVWTSLGPALRRPEGRIHWASTETATEWTGYIEGALQSGERAAAEVLAQTP